MTNLEKSGYGIPRTREARYTASEYMHAFISVSIVMLSWLALGVVLLAVS